MKSSLKLKLKKLTGDPGVYQFFDAQGNLLYVGKAKSLQNRVKSYFSNKNLGPKTDQLVKNIEDIKVIKVASEFEALLLEADLISFHKPFYNIQAKDDKSPIYIKITNDDVPIIELVRKTSTDISKKTFVKGPFPSTRTAKEILRSTRRIFPYCHHKNPKRPCLYVHLGLCPYPYRSDEAKLNYELTITKIKKLLSGKNKQLEREIKKEMTSLANAQKFEEANVLKKQLAQLEYLTTTYTMPREYLEKPTLIDDLTNTRLTDLKTVLNLKKTPRRIECYDISNISGKNATGSMVVFANGRADKGEYRKFKIKFKNTPDDFEMLRETLARRFKNDWPEPDLMIIDGGRGQLSAAVQIAKKYKKEIPIISLAKRLEQIYTPNNFEPISLPVTSPARQLAQSIRDEAHRFAITYHKLLRSKQFLNRSKLEIKGVS